MKCDIDCSDMARSIRDLMTYANFSGLIAQPENGCFLQYSAKSINGSSDEARMEVEIAGNFFAISIKRSEGNP